MRVALCQINIVVGDIEGTVDRVLDWYARARDQGADLAVFPELTLTGYPPWDLLEEPDFLAAVDQAAERLARATGETGLVFGAPLGNRRPLGKPLFNAAFFCAGGTVLGTATKKLLPTYDVFDEARHFASDPEPARAISFRGIRWGLHVCEDAWNDETFWDARLYPRDPVAELAQDGAEVLLNISASPFHAGKDSFRRQVFTNHAKRHGLPVFCTNLIGGNDELIFDGESLAITGDGDIVAAGFSFQEEMLLVDTDHGTPRSASRWCPGEEWAPAPVGPPLEEVRAVRKALALGLSDYARKCGFDRAVLGLSGGIDSAVTAAVAVEALGPDNVLGIALPSRYSSRGSIDDARALATNLGMEFRIIPIEPLFATSLELLDPLFAGTESGVAEENLQARARGNLLMAVSNKFGHLLLTTGNKSEMATGYCTLYGDMAGGLAVLSDVPKMLVYRLAEEFNRKGEQIPESTVRKPPSAELRPDQKDEDSLPPYEILDPLLEGLVEERLTRNQLLERGFDPTMVDRVADMVARAEYKRRQAPPGLRIRAKAFGSGRRMPIATPWPRG